MINSVAKKQIENIREKCNIIRPLVAIDCITYNHESYIRDALEGFVMQKTNFPFIAVVHEDASTDGTANVLKEYAKKYPDIIFPIFEEENQYSKKDGSLRNIMNAAYEATGTKYIALCEGDDYWTDPNKLQKQVDFLESHPDVSLCFHNVVTKNIDGSLQEDLYKIDSNREYSVEEIIRNWTIPTCSVVLKNDPAILKSPLMTNPHYQYGDNVLFLTASCNGKLYGMQERMGVYRRNPQSMTIRIKELEWLKINYIHFKALNKVFGKRLETNVFIEMLSNIGFQILIENKKNLKVFFKYLINSTIDTKFYIFKTAYRKLSPIIKNRF